MKNKTKIITAIAISAILAVSSFAAGTLISIDVDPSIKILVNGEEFHPKDVNGNDVMTFTYNGTTYAPLRALAEAYGLEVGYDAERKMATVDENNLEFNVNIPSGTMIYDDEYVSISYSKIYYSDSWLSEGYHIQLVATNKTDTNLTFILNAIGIDGISYSVGSYLNEAAPNSTGYIDYYFADETAPRFVNSNINGQIIIYDRADEVLDSSYSATFNYYY